MKPREMVKRRDELIREILPELHKIWDLLPHLSTEFKQWPTIARGPIEDGVYQDYLDKLLPLQNTLQLVTRKLNESKLLNEKIGELIKYAYE